MKPVLALFALSFAISAFAAVKTNPDFVTLDMKLEVNGKFVSGPRMIKPYGSKGAIAEQAAGDASSYTVEVSPTKESDTTVALSVAVSQKENGAAKILFTGKLIAEDGKTTELSRQDAGLQNLKLEVTPTL